MTAHPGGSPPRNRAAEAAAQRRARAIRAIGTARARAVGALADLRRLAARDEARDEWEQALGEIADALLAGAGALPGLPPSSLPRRDRCAGGREEER